MKLSIYVLKRSIIVLTSLVVVRAAAADPLPPSPVEPAPTGPEGSSTIDLSYLVDGGALPFFWGAMAGRLALDAWASPRKTPLFFSEKEGGAPRSSWEVPGYAVTGLGVGLGLGMVLSGDDSRMYHVKGMAESLMTGCFVTGAIKTVIGRHRPDWSADINSDSSRRSFPSGHSTQAFAIATYAILYLRGHVFDTREDSVVWELAAYTGIGLGAAAVAGERVWHHRHNLSDVAIGGLLGTVSSSLFYFYQEGRYRDHATKEARGGSAVSKSLTITPAVTPRGAQVGMSFVF
ncbi:MAG: phosphatase PAP2 family protein [Kofleriaceae bacterium]